MTDKNKHQSVMLTTEMALQLNIDKRLEIVSGECVYGMSAFKDFFAGITDAIGGRSSSTQKALKSARKTALDELQKEAYSLGADAVVGVDLDYGEYSGNGKSMLMVIATGTAVTINNENPK